MKDRRLKPVGGHETIHVNKPNRIDAKAPFDEDETFIDNADFDTKQIPTSIVVGGFEEWTLKFSDIQKAMRAGHHTETRYVKSEKNIYMRFIVPAQFVPNRSEGSHNRLWRWEYEIMDDDLVNVVVFHIAACDDVVESSYFDGSQKWIVDWIHRDKLELEQVKGGDKKKVVASDDFLEDVLNDIYMIENRKEEVRASNRQYVRNKRPKYPNEH